MEHFLYDIVDKEDSVNQTDAETIISSFKDASSPYVSNLDEVNTRTALVMSYDLNFTSVQLTKILEYYDISVRKMKKIDKAEAIADFEMADVNTAIVEKRKKYWQWIKELSQDDYFKKYIAVKL
ncbi:MAG: hypothetical protein CMI79_01825 [Candidatus Pelagibacter sp.]|nr:hypothetical protein [Candidatus Pelagibacter sp.]|tara:strand:- start:3926 stop:4297 length:372 start_codon:yes stop_codon:yes gene_type:complete